MDDLISKADVCEILADMYQTDGEAVISYKEIDKAYEKVQNLPTVDAAPVVHGAWKDDRTDIVCTACNERFSDEIVFASLRHCDGEMWMKYCPYCGAKMDLEE